MWTNAMTRKVFEESDNQMEVRAIRGHPKRDRFPVRRLGLAAALLIAVAAMLLIILPSQWPV
jgi:hypothetical protein